MDTSDRFRRSAKTDLGAVYTPENLAEAMSNWTIQQVTDRVLDPSSGDGVFLNAARSRLSELGDSWKDPIGVDIDEEVAKKTGAIHSDFFDWYNIDKRFDAIIGNPPYIRSQIFDQLEKACSFMEKIGVKPKKMMSSWVPFTTLCVGMLEMGGRMSFVLPKEIFHAQYAEPFREWIVKQGNVIVTHTSEQIFEDAQVQPVVVMIERCEDPKELQVLDWSDFLAGDFSNLEAPLKITGIEKSWRNLRLKNQNISFLNKLTKRLDWNEFSDYGEAVVGVVTGNERFFIRSKREFSDVPAANLLPIIKRARDLPGVIFDKSDLDNMDKDHVENRLLNITKTASNETLKKIISQGETEEVHKGYKCRIRKLWYVVPSTYGCDAFMLRQSGKATRLIANQSDATSTSTIHRIRWKNRVDGMKIVACFMNSLTLCFTELMGRPYGGGVLTMVPGDTRKLPLPKTEYMSTDHLKDLDKLVRKGEIEEAVSLVDGVVLSSLSKKDLSKLRKIRKILYDSRSGK